MQSFNYVGSVFSESAMGLWSLVLGASLKLFWAFVIFAVGLILGSWVYVLSKKLFNFIKVEKLSRTVGIDNFLKKAEIEFNLADLLALILRWLVVLVFFLSALDTLGLSSISQVLLSILNYLPNIVAAVFVFVLGYLVANLVEKLIKGAVVSFDKNIASPISVFSRWLILVITAFAALDQLKIAQTLINTFFQGLTYTFVLAVGLSLGLGAKDLVSRVLNDWYDKLIKK
jgi:hypothetical protein